MTTIFQTQALSELNSGEEACELLDGVLLPLLPASPHLLAQRAFCSYSQQNMPEADQLYSQLYAQHPLRLEQVDVYSNILYVLDHRALLANLAQRVIQVDRYRPETCCVVGNCSVRVLCKLKKKTFPLCRQLLQQKGSTRKGGPIFPTSFATQSRICRCVDTDGPRVH